MTYTVSSGALNSTPTNQRGLAVVLGLIGVLCAITCPPIFTLDPCRDLRKNLGRHSRFGAERCNSTWRPRWPPHPYIQHNSICICLGVMNFCLYLGLGGSSVGTMGTPPQVQDLYPQVKDAACQNFKQTTLTTRLYKVRTKWYPHLRKRSDAPVWGSGNPLKSFSG